MIQVDANCSGLNRGIVVPEHKTILVRESVGNHSPKY